MSTLPSWRHGLRIVLSFAPLAIGLLAAVPAQGADPAGPAPGSPLVRAADGRLLAPDIARIVGRGELVVAMFSADSPPFFSEKHGVLRGIDVDLARTIGKELGVPVRFDRSGATVDAVVEMVGQGRADLAIGRLGRSLRRSQMVLFSVPYLMLGHALLINRVRFAEVAGDRPFNQVIRAFKGDIGVIANTSWVEFARRNFPMAAVRPYPDWQTLVDAVTHGEVTTAYRDELEVRGVLQRDPRLALTLRTVTFNDAQSALSVMVGVRDTTLLHFVNEVIGTRADKPSVASALKLVSQDGTDNGKQKRSSP
jgi:polar amino acid transport system substrate-binding protein